MVVKQGTSAYNRKRREPGRIAAIILAVLVHAAFLMLLVFGVSWQSSKPEPVQAELWSRLPPVKVGETKPEPEPEPPKPEPPKPEPPKAEPKPEPPQPTRAEIVLKDKLEKQRKEKLEREKRELEDKQKKQDEAKIKREAEEKVKKEDEAKRLAQEKADAAAKIAAADKAQAAVRQAMDDWKNKISMLVKSRANVPDTVTGKPVIEVRLKLLVNGVVFEAQIAKTSGNRVYDDAVERAIAGIHQWPVPSDPDLFRNNREIILKIDYEK